jgi:hypothetical protein
MDFLRENGFSSSGKGKGGSGVGRGRPRKIRDGVDSLDYGDDSDGVDPDAEKRMTEGILSNFKSDPASKENYLELVGKFSVLARRNGWSRKQLENNMYKAIGKATYAKIGEKGFQQAVNHAYGGTSTK